MRQRQEQSDRPVTEVSGPVTLFLKRKPSDDDFLGWLVTHVGDFETLLHTCVIR